MANAGFNLLIVDDNEMNRETLSRRLNHEGFATEMVASGREALKLLKTQSFDLVLLDIMMPEMDGYQLLQEIRTDKSLSDIAVIIVSAINTLDSMMKCTELGADDYLTKPFDPALLRAAIARSLKRTPTIIPAPVKQRVTTLQTESLLSELVSPKVPLSKEIPASSELSLAEIVSQLLNTGQLTRKSYMHFSKAIFNVLFSTNPLSQGDYERINMVFSYLKSGKIKIID